MAYDPHTLVTFGGTLTEVSGQDEIWQCGVRGVNMPGDGPVGAGQLADLVEAIAIKVDTTQNLLGWYQTVAYHQSATALLKWVKAVNIGPDGKYSSDPHTYTYTTPGTGGGGGAVPSFLSVCYSWTTARNYGRKLRNGRIYPPNFAASVVAGGATISEPTQAQLLEGAGVLLSALARSADEYNFVPCVVSSQGGHEPITGVRVGNVFDVHRSRKDAVRETYEAAVWP